jgi:Fic family protein
MENINKFHEIQKEYKLLVQNHRIDMNKYYDDFFIQKAFYSAKIYGCNFTLEEAAAFLLEGKTATGKDLIDYIILENTYNAIKWFHSIIDSSNFLDIRTLKRMNLLLLEGIDFRKVKVAGKDIRKKIVKGEFQKPDPFPSVSDMNDNEKTNDQIIAEQITELLDGLLYCHNFSIEYAVDFFFNFHQIAPFEMGNSRLNRIIINFPLIKGYFLPVIFKDTDGANYDQSITAADSGDKSLLYNLVLEKLIESYERAINLKT